ncbi:YbcC family protein [Paracoccus sp. T5]|uniref:YbcC family protein n=1 Tax=Paracoccus sp. T5 TaxID=3402161 RepID=UPI003AE6105D
MFLNHASITADQAADLLDAATAAARAVPPAFPLSATVAVNPFLGQTEEDLATAAARLSRVAGLSLTRPRADFAAEVASGRISDDDLAAALIASTSALKPVDLAMLKARLACPAATPEALPTLADLAAVATGTDWPAIIARAVGLWAAGRFDQGQALWTPAPNQDAFSAWREWATHDLTPEIAGLAGFCAHVAACPDTAERAILRAADRLSLTAASAPTAFHRLLIDLGGWAQHARWLSWQTELEGGDDATLTDLLAIRLIWDEALLAHLPQLAQPWAEVVARHALPVEPSADQVLDAILQDASERAHQRRLAARLAGQRSLHGRPALQAAFCIDVRSETFRRALEDVAPTVDTIGFAGFFGLPLAHHPHASDQVEAHLPVLLRPGLQATSQGSAASEQDARISARAARAWGRFRQAAVSSFAFVEAAGPIYGAKLLKDALGRGHGPMPAPGPRLANSLAAEAKGELAAKVLRAMGLTQGHARLILLVGHGAHVTNNPHESAYHCGACGGRTGEVSARVLAGLLNDAETRAALPAQGITLPEDTLFVAALHDTTTDQVTLYQEGPTRDHAADLAQARTWLDQAGARTRAERAPRLPGGSAATLAARAANWAETRPEWGLAGCAAFIAAPRAATRGVDLGGRAFLHSYDRDQDPDFGVLELILTAPVVVASWISLQYYGSTVAPQVFGGGNKLIHNVTGGIGVVEGNGGRLRPGLPWQAVHDGTRPSHEALRLTVMIDAPTAAMSDILARHPGVRALFDNGWLHLLALDGGKVAARYRPGGEWRAETAA